MCVACIQVQAVTIGMQSLVRTDDNVNFLTGQRLQTLPGTLLMAFASMRQP